MSKKVGPTSPVSTPPYIQTPPKSENDDTDEDDEMEGAEEDTEAEFKRQQRAQKKMHPKPPLQKTQSKNFKDPTEKSTNKVSPSILVFTN